MAAQTLRFRPEMVLDATELGDLLPLAGAEYSVGAETIADTGEAHAQPSERKPHCVQSFTYVFGLERRPAGENHAIGQPARYEYFRAAQPYSLKIEVHGGEIYGEESGWLDYNLYDTMPGNKRRSVDLPPVDRQRAIFVRLATDLSMFNWPGNDYRESTIIDVPAAQAAAALQDAKRVSLGFLHWVQTEAPAGGAFRRSGAETASGHHGYARWPGQVSLHSRGAPHQGSAHGRGAGCLGRVSERPARGALRGLGRRRLVSHRYPSRRPRRCRHKLQDAPVSDSAGRAHSRSHQQPAAAAKNIGTTHITNGCFRLHPVEWNIGEAAGSLAAFCLDRGRAAAAVYADTKLRSAFQNSLLAEGVPLAWLVDIGVDHPGFAAVQSLAVKGHGLRPDDLNFHPEAALSVDEWKAWGGQGDVPADRLAAALRLLPAMAT